VLPFSKSADHIGVFSLSIKIIQKAMEAAAEDWCSLMPVKDPGLIRAIIIPCGPYLDHADQDMKTELDIAARKLENKGFTIKRINCFDNFEHIETMHRQLIAREFYETHQSRLKRYGHLFRKGTLSLINQGLNISEYDYEKALQTRFEFAFECANILYDNQAIMFMTPSSVSRAPKGFESTGDPIMNLPWTYSGMPAFNVPVNMDKCRKNPGTLPAGLQFTAPRGMDEELLSYMNLISDIIG
jgi:Asp-tRNA(Asn)/Glu-tRNA(Gln) amidotransferase A subunit family amidase